ncbi:hypothetical protein FN846DRAFT_910638 [Sphaerosporella brunnea]|uniref:Uncharacterized protein n=1 Tax=Sphaerosporella brunnea TaxID=1250544 RepID=A0A5J5EMM2_9PEZI|nr:hypothetical protein FN846DRAFT_910638 [Sphaerosporella brunnea]
MTMMAVDLLVPDSAVVAVNFRKMTMTAVPDSAVVALDFRKMTMTPVELLVPDWAVVTVNFRKMTMTAVDLLLPDSAVVQMWASGIRSRHLPGNKKLRPEATTHDIDDSTSKHGLSPARPPLMHPLPQPATPLLAADAGAIGNCVRFVRSSVFQKGTAIKQPTKACGPAWPRGPAAARKGQQPSPMPDAEYSGDGSPFSWRLARGSLQRPSRATSWARYSVPGQDEGAHTTLWQGVLDALRAVTHMDWELVTFEITTKDSHPLIAAFPLKAGGADDWTHVQLAWEEIYPGLCKGKHLKDYLVVSGTKTQ